MYSTEKIEAQRTELAEQGARIAQDAQLVESAKCAERQLARKDAIIKDKDAEIARLRARMVQFEQLAALMNAVTQPASEAAAGGSKRTASSEAQHKAAANETGTVLLNSI